MIDVIIFVTTVIYVVTSAGFIYWLLYIMKKRVDEAYTEGVLDGLDVKQKVEQMILEMEGGDK